MHGVDVTDKNFDRVALRRAWKFARPYRTKLFVNLCTILLGAGVAVLPPLVFRYLIDHAIPRHDLRMANVAFVIAVVLAIVNTGFGLVNRWFSATIGEGLIFDLRSKLYEHIQRMPIGFFTRTQTGSLLSRLNSDVVGAQATVTTAATVVADLVTLGTTICAMALLSWRVTVLAMLIIPFLVLLDRLLSGRIADLSRRRMHANADMTTNMQERFNVSGALLVKLFGQQARELARFRERAGEVRDAGVRTSMFSRLYYAALAMTGSIGVAIVYWWGTRSVIEGSLTIGTLTALAAYVIRLYEPMTSIAGARVELLTALVSFERCFEVLDAPVHIESPPNPKVVEKPEGRLTFENVYFRYPAPSSQSIKSLEGAYELSDDEPSTGWALKDLTLDVAPGQTVALVGHSGAGKSTMSSLITRQYDVNEGSIKLDGIDIRSLDLENLRSAIGVVSQDTHLFHDTVESNLRYARPGATDEELRSACEAARISEVIDALPNGYRTLVGERGYRLSGGEKQRLAIARVLLKKPAIVVLDEATAHLDSGTELLVQQALSEALENRTAVVIAHRLSTIRNADKIVVLDKGRIVEVGSHEGLLASNGDYARLYKTQFAPTQGD